MTTADRKRERKICEAGVQALEKLIGIGCDATTYPEDSPLDYNCKELVDCVASIGPTKIAIEVTLIQTIPRQVYSGIKLNALQDHIKPQLLGKLLPPASYNLVIPAGKTLDISREPGLQAANSLTEWIIDEAPNLGLTAPGHFKRATPFGLEFEVCLYRFPARLNSFCFQVTNSIEGNFLDQLRITVRCSLNKKLPKLACWQARAKTVLIVEMHDFVLSDEYELAQIFTETLQSRCECLDYLFIVDTAVCPWRIFLIHPGGSTDCPLIDEIDAFHKRMP